jgi:hypothetical protein
MGVVYWAAQLCPLSNSCVICCGGVGWGTVEPRGVGAGVRSDFWRVVIVVLDYIAVPEAVEDKAMYLG